MKKYITSTFLLLLLLGTMVISFADHTTEQNITTIDITYDQYIKSLAESLNVSVEDAVKIDIKQNELYERELQKRHPELFGNMKLINNNLMSYSGTTSGSYTYKTISKTQTYYRNGNFSASVNANLKIYTNGSFGEIVQVMGSVYSNRVSGLYSYQWIQLNSWHDPSGGSYPTTAVTINATGYFTVQVQSGVQIPGFSISGTDTWQSDNMSINYTYSLY